jgi:hypothetical protein
MISARLKKPKLQSRYFERLRTFFLAARRTFITNLKQTSIAWAEIADAFENAKGRIFVFLDACHAGAAGNGSNDDAVSVLTESKDGLTIVSAAKGRKKRS